VVINAKLLAIKDGNYTVYVFKNLDTGSYLMCTKLPNWQTSNVSVGDEGFLKYEEVKAGEEYFNPGTETKEIYNYSNVYFVNFLQKSEIVSSNIIL